jgi:hypothetical protein
MATKKKEEPKQNEVLDKLQKWTGINDEIPEVNKETKPKTTTKQVSNETTNVTSNNNINVKPIETIDDIDVDTSDVSSIVDDFHRQQMEKEYETEIKGNYTLVVRHDLMERLDELDAHFKRGFKSDLVNKALETFISKYEQIELPPKRKRRGRR